LRCGAASGTEVVALTRVMATAWETRGYWIPLKLPKTAPGLLEGSEGHPDRREGTVRPAMTWSKTMGTGDVQDCCLPPHGRDQPAPRCLRRSRAGGVTEALKQFPWRGSRNQQQAPVLCVSQWISGARHVFLALRQPISTGGCVWQEPSHRFADVGNNISCSASCSAEFNSRRLPPPLDHSDK
jgi:hypothetical protein